MSITPWMDRRSVNLDWRSGTFRRAQLHPSRFARSRFLIGLIGCWPSVRRRAWDRGWPIGEALRLEPSMAVNEMLCLDPAMARETIADFEDERLEIYRNLKDSTLAGARGRFIAEGRGVLRVLLSRSNYRPESILLNERTFSAIRSELEAFAPDCPIYLAEQSVLDQVVGFPIHRGCLAACRRRDVDLPMELAREVLQGEAAPRVVVLEGLTNLDNLGLIFRNAMALGARAIFLCPKSCDPLYRKAIRTSMGGSLCVPFARAKNFGELLAGLRKLGFEVLAFHPGEGSVDLYSLQSHQLGPTALLFGTEGPGLTDTALLGASRCVRIGMESGVDSLNVGVAAGIGLSTLRLEAETKEIRRD